MASQRKRVYSEIIFIILFLLQFIILIGTYLHARTPLMWIWSVASFIPATVVCLSSNEKKHVLASLVVLFITQQAIFIFANATWGFDYGSDQINDFHTAQAMSERSHFELGQLGYASRLSYSYYPMLHLFSVMTSDVTGLPLIYVALYFPQILNAILVTFLLYYLNHDLFGLEGRERNISTLFFEMSFVYTSFDSQFVRETFAFPLALFSLWIAARIATTHGGSRNYAIIAVISFAAVVLSHQFSSFLLLVILAVMTLSFKIFYRNSRLILPLLLMATILGAYTVFVTPTFTATELTYAYEGLQAIFHRVSSVTIMRPYESWRLDLALIQYAIICVLVAMGGLKLLRQQRKNWVVVTLMSFFVLSFLLCIALRLSTPADPWSFTYYMSLRGTIWAFIGISVLAALGIKYIVRLNTRVSAKIYFAVLLTVVVLAAGKFSQYDRLVSDSTVTPNVTYPRYTASIWLRNETTHGSLLLVAPDRPDVESFDGSGCMAPYAYLKEYFLDESKGRVYNNFYGYIPFIGGFFDQYKNASNVQIIYSNGNVEVGYKEQT